MDLFENMVGDYLRADTLGASRENSVVDKLVVRFGPGLPRKSCELGVPRDPGGPEKTSGQGPTGLKNEKG